MPRTSTAKIAAIILALVLVGLVPPPSVKAAAVQWFVEVLTYPLSKEPELQARIFTRLGFLMHVMRMKDKSIWAEFRLPRSSRADLTSRRLPKLWIDDNDPIDLEVLKELELGFKPTLYRLDGRGLFFIIWAGAQPGFIPPILRQMMLGENLYVQYHTQMGEEGAAKVSLNRANDAIAQFLKVAPLDRSGAQKATASTDFSILSKHFVELYDELRFSADDRDYSACRDKFANCSEKAEQTAVTLRQCLEYYR